MKNYFSPFPCLHVLGLEKLITCDGTSMGTQNIYPQPPPSPARALVGRAGRKAKYMAINAPKQIKCGEAADRSDIHNEALLRVAEH